MDHIDHILLRENKEILIFCIKFNYTINHLATESKILKNYKNIQSEIIYRGKNLFCLDKSLDKVVRMILIGQTLQ